MARKKSNERPAPAKPAQAKPAPVTSRPASPPPAPVKPAKPEPAKPEPVKLVRNAPRTMPTARDIPPGMEQPAPAPVAKPAPAPAPAPVAKPVPAPVPAPAPAPVAKPVPVVKPTREELRSSVARQLLCRLDARQNSGARVYDGDRLLLEHGVEFVAMCLDDSSDPAYQAMVAGADRVEVFAR